MDMELIQIALTGLALLGCIGLFFGIGLALAAHRFKVETNPMIDEVLEVLPKANCGGCGYAGCEGYAQAVVENPDVAPNLCFPGKEAVGAKVAAITHKELKKVENSVARVRCRRQDGHVSHKHYYIGFESCAAANLAYGGSSKCQYACIGMGDCVKACRFQAIEIVDHMPQIHALKCVGCGACARTCPKQVIEIQSADARVFVPCSSKDKGKDVRDVCEVGCIGCQICVKFCPSKAISCKDNKIYIDTRKCNQTATCKMICVEKCPRHILTQIKTKKYDIFADIKKESAKRSQKISPLVADSSLDNKVTLQVKRNDLLADNTGKSANEQVTVTLKPGNLKKLTEKVEKSIAENEETAATAAATDTAAAQAADNEKKEQPAADKATVMMQCIDLQKVTSNNRNEVKNSGTSQTRSRRKEKKENEKRSDSSENTVIAQSNDSETIHGELSIGDKLQSSAKVLASTYPNEYATLQGNVSIREKLQLCADIIANKNTCEYATLKKDEFETLKSGAGFTPIKKKTERAASKKESSENLKVSADRSASKETTEFATIQSEVFDNLKSRANISEAKATTEFATIQSELLKDFKSNAKASASKAKTEFATLQGESFEDIKANAGASDSQNSTEFATLQGESFEDIKANAGASDSQNPTEFATLQGESFEDIKASADASNGINELETLQDDIFEDLKSSAGELASNLTNEFALLKKTDISDGWDD